MSGTKSASGLAGFLFRLLVTAGALVLIMLVWDYSKIGSVMDSHRGVPVYDNGIMFFRGQGKHYAKDGYYYGQKWQCVEFIKRFYKDAFNHEMPNGWGHARDFYDTRIPDGQLNPKRGLLQFSNGSTTPPQPDDIIVFQDSQYGHVGIVTAVHADRIEIIQQNIFAKPRQEFGLHKRNGRYYVENPRIGAGWLRLPGSTGKTTSKTGPEESDQDKTGSNKP